MFCCTEMYCQFKHNSHTLAKQHLCWEMLSDGEIISVQAALKVIFTGVYIYVMVTFKKGNIQLIIVVLPTYFIPTYCFNLFIMIFNENIHTCERNTV